MKKLILIALVALAGWQAYGKYQGQHLAFADDDTVSAAAEPIRARSTQSAASAAPSFRCDGRTHCTQMTSCAEATFFLRNCPGVKMDGDNDGIPCERQWCN